MEITGVEGMNPVHEAEHPDDWDAHVKAWLKAFGIAVDLVVLTEGLSSKHPVEKHRMGMVDLRD